MFGSETLEVGIGLVFFFLLVSLMCSAAREALEGIMKTRAMDLERALRELLSDSKGMSVTKALFDHPMVFSLYPGGYTPERLKKTWSLFQVFDRFHMPWRVRRNLPSYIPSGHFASALLDVVARGPATQAGDGAARKETVAPGAPLTIDALRAAAVTFPNERVRRAVLFAIDTAGNDMDKVKANLEDWFNGAMDRTSGWYKRRTQTILFVIGLGAAVLLNLDSITVAQHLALDRVLRQTAMAEAEALNTRANNGGAPEPLAQDFRSLETRIRSIGFPIGWAAGLPNPQATACPAANGAASAVQPWVRPEALPGFIPRPVRVAIAGFVSEPDASGCRRVLAGGFFAVLLGWLMTALAVMLGAPFWFDVLNKFMIVRSTIKPRQKSREEGSIEPAPKGPALAIAAPVAAMPRPAEPH